MPTSTFYNLPEEKRQKLMDAIYAEIRRVPYDEISINQIIQTAQISRGSFYQYFNGKDDMMQMLLGAFSRKLRQMTLQSLQKHKGDPFGVVVDALDLFCVLSEKEEMRRLYHHLLSGLRVIDERFSCKSVGLPCKDGYQIHTQIDLSLLDIQTENDLFDMAEMLMDLLKWALSELMAHPDQKELIRARFLNKLSILKRGFSARKENA